MTETADELVIDELAKAAAIPKSSRRKAEARYKDLGEWFCRDDAHCAGHDPHIRAQGSFRLGTVVRAEEYDLDFGCRLREGVTKRSHTQEQLKHLVLADLEAYRQARGIQHEVEEKGRCWRLKYQDEVAFHMDGVPSIPEGQDRRKNLEASMTGGGIDPRIVGAVAEHAGAITDNKRWNYRVVDQDWMVSNAEGYALWFESRVRLFSRVAEDRTMAAKAGTVDALPLSDWDSPLQQAVQVLKCHRNRMFEDAPDRKPISIILTTLAARAYEGEDTVASAIGGILTRMGHEVADEKPRVPNPVNPVEDFADKWDNPAHRELELEKNFRLWLDQARADFRALSASRDPAFIAENAQRKLGLRLEEKTLTKRFGAAGVAAVTRPVEEQVIRGTPGAPWRRS